MYLKQCYINYKKHTFVNNHANISPDDTGATCFYRSLRKSVNDYRRLEINIYVLLAFVQFSKIINIVSCK